VRSTRIPVLIALVALGATVFGADPGRVEVLSWQAPHPGWLYVVDATTAQSRIFLFDPERGEATGTIRTGYNPDIAISPRGDRVYIASVVVGCGQSSCDQLTVIDTQAGRVLSTTPIPNRVHYKIYPESSRMAVSSDGRTLYLMKWQGLPSGDVALAAFDTVREQFLDGVIDLGNCGFGTFVPATDANQLGFHCPTSNEIVFYRLTAPDRATFEFSVRLPRGQRLFAGHVYPDVSARAFMLTTDRRELFVAGGDGAIADVNLTLGSVKDTPVVGSQTEVVAPFASPGALDRARFFVGVGPFDGQGVAREIRIFDTTTWARVGTIRTSTPFVAAVATRDGAMIYAPTGENGKILAVDPVAQRELRAMPLGQAPSLALIAP
jgi:hypothetical protein